MERMEVWHSRNALRRYLKVDIEDALFSLSATLKLTRELKSSDPRDAVYGILGTAMNPEVIKVDYSKTLREVLVETAHCLIFDPDDVTHPLTILYQADHPGKPKQPEIPSWVPRWHEPEQCHGMYSSNGNHNAGGALNYDLKKLQGTSYRDKLRVRGYILDIISTKSDFSCPTSEEEKGFFGVLLALPSLMYPPGSPYITGESALEVYAQTSTLGGNFHFAHYGSMLGSFLGEAAQQGLNDNRIEGMLLQYWGIFEHWAQNVDEFDELVRDEALDWAAEFMSSVHTAFRNRHAFRTNKGYLGVGPSSFLLGDQVCVLFGSRVPFVLREMEDNMFSFIGSCYVHGIMHGETLEDGCKMSRDFILR